MTRERRMLGLVIATFLVASVFFLRRPWLFDDPVVLLSARAAALHPLHPFDYTLDLAYPDTPIWPRGAMGPAHTHPPFSSWVLGYWMRLVGEHEVALHAVMVAWSVASLMAAAFLLGVLGQATAPVVGALVASPVFFLTTLTLYPHFFYVTFYWLALALAWRTLAAPSPLKTVALGAALIGAAFSLDHWPVLVFLIALASLQPRASGGRRAVALALALFAVVYGAWCVWELHLRGMTHLHANLLVRVRGAYAWRAAFLPLVFLSGAVPLIGVAWRTLRRESPTIFTVLLGAAVAGALFFHSARGGFSASQAFLIAVELTTGLAFLAALVLRLRAPLDAVDRVLLVWFGIEFVFVLRFLPWPSGHHLLQVALPALLLAYRMHQRAGGTPFGWMSAVILSGILTLTVAQGDLQEAWLGPRLAHDVAQVPAPRYYWGNDFSGLSWYLKQAGWRPYDSRVPLPAGAYVLMAHNLNMQGPPFFLRTQRMARVADLPYRIASPWRTLSINDSAGWYSASWGALPFSWSTQPADVFTLYRASAASSR